MAGLRDYYQRFREYIWANHLIQEGDTVAAGISGGSDSVAMLHMLSRLRQEYPFDLYALHVHHGIRGSEADEDEEYVRVLCCQLNLPFESYHYDVPLLSRDWRMGTEQTARLCREAAFEKLREKLGKEKEEYKAALAHSRDDQAETVLQHLCRGSGIRGMAGIRPVQSGKIRPVLDFSRDELIQYIQDCGLAYRIDSSNATDTYTRNRVRSHVLPLLEREVNEESRLHLAQTASFCLQAELFLATEAARRSLDYLLPTDEAGNRGLLVKETLLREPQIMISYILRQAIEGVTEKQQDITSVHLHKTQGLFGKPEGKRVLLPFHLLAIRRREGVLLQLQGSGKHGDDSDGKKTAEVFRLDPQGETVTPFGIYRCRLFDYQGQEIVEKKCTKWFDYDKIKDNLLIRTRREGDGFLLSPSGGRKSLRRWMIDEKIPGGERDAVPLLVSGSEVLWIVGFRMGAWGKVSLRTKRILEVNVTVPSGISSRLQGKNCICEAEGAQPLRG